MHKNDDFSIWIYKYYLIRYYVTLTKDMLSSNYYIQSTKPLYMKQFEVYYNIRVSKIDIELCYWKRIWHYGKLKMNKKLLLVESCVTMTKVLLKEQLVPNFNL